MKKFMRVHPSPNATSKINLFGGADGVRTRDLLRDRQAF